MAGAAQLGARRLQLNALLGATSALRQCTFSTESAKALKILTLFPKEFAKALNTISA
jgi:hypothetical protein